mgnify:CR=1 FL=1
MLTLGQAAKLAGVGKTTLARAIKSGRMSATRRDDGGYSVDPAELGRVYTLKPAPPATGETTGEAAHHATGGRDGAATHGDSVSLLVRVAALEAELTGLREMAAELRASRDGWQAQAERATLALADLRDARPWWRRLAG